MMRSGCRRGGTANCISILASQYLDLVNRMNLESGTEGAFEGWDLVNRTHNEPQFKREGN